VAPPKHGPHHKCRLGGMKMSYQVMMFCRVDPSDIGVFGERVCSNVASQCEGVVYSNVSASSDSNAYRIETASGQELDIQFYWAGMYFEHSIAMASHEPDSGLAPDSTCIISMDLSGDVPWFVISKIWDNVSSDNSAVLYDEADGFAASLNAP
jgi:hypothetical protein